MTYWNNVLSEVLNKDRPGAECLLTSVGVKAVTSRAPARRCPQRKVLRKVYFIGASYPGVYLTRREAQCLVFMVRGYTLKEIGSRLGLSARTIECYARGVRVKFACSSRARLIEAVVASEFDLSAVDLPVLH